VNAKSPPKGLKDSECMWGDIVNCPTIPYVQPADLNKKQEKTKIMVKLPDGTNYQMVQGHVAQWLDRRFKYLRLGVQSLAKCSC
jgi:hypothetical protein